VPCVWKPDDDIDGAFKAKDATLELIALYAKITPQDPELAYTPPEDDESDALGLVVFSETKALELGVRFRREATHTTSRRNGARSRASRRSRTGSTAYSLSSDGTKQC